LSSQVALRFFNRLVEKLSPFHRFALQLGRMPEDLSCMPKEMG